ncbi:MAG TPA: hypothetical protein VEQ37_14735 [Actinomycetota bacterium]|nr:hypothetical protein [Actinomycetota bacterium]
MHPERGESWLASEAERSGGALQEGGGLLPSFDALASPDFDPRRLQPPIVAFYQRTTDWRLDVWSQWCPPVWPVGWLLSAVFARRLQQFALPLRPLDVALGMDRRVMRVCDSLDRQLGAYRLEPKPRLLCE